MNASPKTFTALGILTLVLGITPAFAAPVFYSGTGHWYQPIKVPGGLSWNDAYTNAVNRSGYLCTVTNAGENSFVAALVDASYYSGLSVNNDILGPWLGAFRQANEANWQWITGENFIYSNWSPGQPDGFGGSEQRLQFYAGASTGSTWGDHPDHEIPGYSSPRGYIVEYNQPPLSITKSDSLITIFWPQPTAGWLLETTPALSSSSNVWSQVSTNQYQTNLTSSFITVTNPIGNAFYRLRKN